MEEAPVQSLRHYYSSLVPENPHNRLFFSQYSSSPLLQYSETQNSKAEPLSLNTPTGRGFLRRNKALIVTARNMNSRERRRYEKK